MTAFEAWRTWLSSGPENATRRRGYGWGQAAALLATLGLLGTGCNWPMFRYSPARTGFNSSETAISVDNVSDLLERFSADYGHCHSTTEHPCPSPTVAGGMVYIGSDTELQAFDATTGSRRWTAPTGQVWSTAAVANRVVYVGSNDHKLYAFDATGATNCSGSPATCAPLWTADTGDADGAR